MAAFKRTLRSLCLTGAAIFALIPVAGAPAPVLPTRESLSYTVDWRLINAGKTRLVWGPGPDGGWKADLHIESMGLVSRLFKVDDTYSSTMTSELCAQQSYLKAFEGSRQRETRVLYHADRRKAEYVEQDIAANKLVDKHEIDIPPCVSDIVGALYQLRTLKLEPGQTGQIRLSDGKKSIQARVESQLREQIKTPAGVYRAIRYEAFLFNNVLFKRNGRLYIWLTDDDSKVPVQIQVRLQFHIGTITLMLEKQERS